VAAVKRDSRIQPRRVEIRNWQPEDHDGEDEGETVGTEEPWERIEEELDPFEDRHADAIVDLVQAGLHREQCFSETTQAVHEALVEAARHELRQLFTRIENQLELNLMRTSADKPPLSREEARDVVEVVRHGGEILDAQLSREQVSRRLLDLHMAGFALSEAIRDHLQDSGLEQQIHTDLDPAPVLGDSERLPEAFALLAQPFLDACGDGQRPVIEVEWTGDLVKVFVGSCPPTLPEHELQERLSRSVLQSGRDSDLSRALEIVEAHQGRVIVRSRENAIGYECPLPAIDPAGLG
jgi:signal transduction histidine kinase